MRRLVLLVMAGGVLAPSGGRPASPPSTALKAAWIYVGSASDAGWTKAHDDGRLYVQQQLGSKVVTTFKENVPEDKVAPVIDSLVQDGNKIIFATSFGYQNAMAAAAKKYPK